MPNNQALPSGPESGHDQQMSARRTVKALATNEAMQTVGFGGFGLAFVGLMLIGGAFVSIGLTLAIACCVVVVVLHWQEMLRAFKARRFNRHFVLPIAVVICVPLIGVMVANKDAVLAWWQPSSAPLIRQKPHGADLRIVSVLTVPTAEGGQTVKFSTDNQGDLAAKTSAWSIMIDNGASDKPAAAQVEGRVNELRQEFLNRQILSDLNDDIEIEPKQPPLISGSTVAVLKKDWKQYLAGKEYFFVFIFVSYTDELTPPGKRWVTEFAAPLPKPTEHELNVLWYRRYITDI